MFSQNIPLTENNILKYLETNFTNWTSGNEKIDDFIQERQLKINDSNDINNYDNIVPEWISYNQFSKIKETSKNSLITVYSAIWKDGPLYYKYDILNYQYGEWTRNPNRRVVLKCLHNSQESIDSLIDKAKKYPVSHKRFQALYGMSQNPDTGDYILVLIWTSGNEKIDDFIQERQLKINDYDIVFEWIPYNQFNEIKETGKNSLITVYSAIWKDGPLHYKYSILHYQYGEWTRNPNKEVALKCLHNSQESIDSLIDKAKKYPVSHKRFQALYGMSQNPDTGDYILVLIWTSGNEKIDDFIQERQLKINDYDIVFEWIPYNQFNEIKETGKNSLITVYSAIWKDGPLHYKYSILHYQYGEWTRNPNKEVALKCLHNSQESINSLIDEAKKYSKSHREFQALYGISQNLDTGDYILVQNNYLWTSGNEKIDDFIQERQLKINNYNDIVLEWIPYNQFNEIKETGKNGLITVYSAIWKDGPLHNKHKQDKYTRDSNKEVALKCLHKSQESIDSLIDEAKKYPESHKAFQALYGISQNPDTGDYILVLIWTSGNEKIDDFVQERQLKINNYNDIVLEWIPYNQFNEIKETGKNSLITVYSAIWKDGPLHNKHKQDKYTRDSNKEVALKCLHKSQESIDSLIDEAKKYPESHKAFQALYGISQNPDTGDYILVLIWTSGNEKIDDFIQERQLETNNYNNTVLEWIQYNQFNEIKETGKNSLITVYSAIWKDGPLYYQYGKCTRDPNKEVALKCLHKSQESIDSLIDEAKKYPVLHKEFQALYGITQNPDTGDYVLVLIWTSGNEKIDDFVQERQLKINNYNDIVLEWIPYNQFNEIKETGKNGFITVYSAIWKDGPLHNKHKRDKYTRDSNKEVALKCLHKSQESIDSLIDEAKKYPESHKAFQALYGISQNLDTGDYILVLIWTSGNEKIDDFVQERQLKINNYNDIVLEWIPYNQFNEIKETGKNGLITVYSAIWKDGPLHKKHKWGEYTRDSNKEVALKCLHKSQESIDSLIDEAKKYPTKHKAFQVLYGISQNPNTGDYILVQNSSINSANQTSGNEKIDDFIQERQLIINNYDDIVFEWISHNQFNEIKEIGKNVLITVYSATWIDGPLYYSYKDRNYIRDSNKEVVLKYLHNSQNIKSLTAEAKKYPSKHKAIQVLYGITQNPDTGNYLLVQNNYNVWISENEKIDDLIQEMQFKINNHDDIVFEWIPYSQFNNIKEVGKGGFAIVYSANWKNGPLEYDADNKIYKRNPNIVIALKHLYNSQNISNKFLNEVNKYSINKRSNILNIYGISQNPDTKEYIMVLQYAKEGNFNHWIDKNYEHFNWRDKLSALLNIINGLKEIHQNSIVHRDFHTGNILFLSEIYNFGNCISISDMGLCGEVGIIDETKIYGVMPYVAPEVLRRKSYTQESDIYSFGMIMYFVATGRQPFYNRAHDHLLALDICKEVRPEINEPEAPRSYIDLMKKCWDLNLNNRPNIFEVNKLIMSFHKSYGMDFFIVENEEIGMQFKKAEEYRKENLSSFIKNYQTTTHPQAIYTSRLLNPFTEDLPEYGDNSQCLDQAI